MTWSRPVAAETMTPLGQRLQKLNGWQRLWLIAVAVWFAVCITIATLNFPTRDKLQTAAIVAMNEMYQSLGEAAESQREHCRRFISAEDYRDGVPCMKMAGEAKQHYRKTVDEAVSRQYARIDHDLMATQAAAIAWGLALWMVPSVLLYGFGLALTWARAGFTKRSS